VLLVVNPELSSMLDAAKVEAVVDIVGGSLGGIILNRVPPYHIAQTVQSIGSVMSGQILGVIPEDSNVRTATAFKTPVVIRYPESPASRGYKALAARLVGDVYERSRGNAHIHPVLAPKKENFVDRLTRSVFGDL